MNKLYPIVLMTAIAALSGCEKEGVQQYKAAKDDAQKPKREVELPPAPQPVKSEGEQRLLGAVAFHANKTWFFKLMGPAKDVAAQKDNFHGFGHSLEFTDDPKQPVKWELPEGWRQLENSGSAMRYATIKIGELDMSVIPLEGDGGGTLENINRWRGQIGLQPVGDLGELKSLASTHEVNGKPVMEIDMTGPGGAASSAPPFAGAAPSNPAPFAGGTPGAPPAAGQNLAPVIEKSPEDSPLTYTVPKGWKEHEPGGMRKADFSVGEGKEVAQTTAIPLGGPAGGVLGNVNRWRGQVGLEATDTETLAKEAKEIELGGIKGQYVDIAGPAGEGGAKRILGVIVKKDDTSWFIKMFGPAELVGKEKANFEALVKSMKFKE